MDLADLGWNDRWAALLAELPGAPRQGRVVRHLGAGLVVATADGVVQVPLALRLDPEPVVGDWLALDDGNGGVPVAVLPRASLLRRRDPIKEAPQPLAANVDAVLLVCGLDRPVGAGRLQRGAALAADAGAEPVVVLTKAAAGGRLDERAVGRAREVAARAVPGLEVVVTSVREGVGVDELRRLVRGRTVVLVGESGAGKSTIVNALAGDEVAATGEVRARDAKGRHTTTARQLHLVPGGGVVVDTPGLRAVGLWLDPEAVDRTFPDVAAAAEACRFADCTHRAEPGCGVRDAVEAGRLDPDRVAAWRELRAEAEAAAGAGRRR